MRPTMLAVRSIGLLGLTFATAASAAADLKSPDDVKTALRLMMQVTNDFDRQITRKTYARLSHENEEFKEATGALRTAIANEPAPFKSKVDPEIQKALTDAQATVDLAPTNDDSKLRAAQGVMLKQVNAVFADFPPELRPDPNVQPGGRPAAAPAN